MVHIVHTQYPGYIVDHVSTDTTEKNVEQMDEEELSLVILLCKGLKFTVTPTNRVCARDVSKFSNPKLKSY